MKPKFLLFASLACTLLATKPLQSQAEPLYDDTKDDMYQEFMKCASDVYSQCLYDSVHFFTDGALVYAQTQVQKDDASILLEHAMLCKKYKEKGVDYMLSAEYREAVGCFGNVLKLNSHDQYCRERYSEGNKLLCRKIEDLDMVILPGGSVSMGRNDGAYDEGPVYKTSVTRFAIMRHEISNSKYCVFLNAEGNVTTHGYTCVNIKDPNCHIKETSEGWYEPEKGYEEYPATCVSFFGATAFCDWLGLQLMTEAQFEYAFDKSVKADSPSGTMPVNAGVPNKYNIYNLNGNVAEWTREIYDRDKYHKNRNGIENFETVTIRGGAFDSRSDINPKTYRHNLPFESYPANTGFRCVMELPEQ